MLTNVVHSRQRNNDRIVQKSQKKLKSWGLHYVLGSDERSGCYDCSCCYFVLYVLYLYIYIALLEMHTNQNYGPLSTLSRSVFQAFNLLHYATDTPEATKSHIGLLKPIKSLPLISQPIFDIIESAHTSGPLAHLR